MILIVLGVFVYKNFSDSVEHEQCVHKIWMEKKWATKALLFTFWRINSRVLYFIRKIPSSLCRKETKASNEMGEGKVYVSQCNVCHCWTGALLFEFVFPSTVLETLFMRRLKVLPLFMRKKTSREHFKIDPIYVSQTAASSLRPHHFGPNMQFNEPILSFWLRGPFPSTLFKASTSDGRKINKKRFS